MISVILTVFNKSEYIEKCIESIENNIYKNIELIIVDDCSTDNSLSIIEEKKKQYNNIIVIKNNINKGAGYSRNIGIKKSNGEYICFIDGDDYVDEDYFQTLINSMESDIDIVFSGYKEISSNGKLLSQFKRQNIIYDDINDCLLKACEYNMQFLTCCLIRKKLFNCADYCKSRVVEDTPTAYLLIFHSKKIKCIDYCGYNYVQFDNSLIHNVSLIESLLWYYYNMITVINHIKKINSFIGIKLFNSIKNKINKIGYNFKMDLNDLSLIFNKADTIFEYYEIDSNYIKDTKLYAIRNSNCIRIKKG